MTILHFKNKSHNTHWHRYIHNFFIIVFVGWEMLLKRIHYTKQTSANSSTAARRNTKEQNHPTAVARQTESKRLRDAAVGWRTHFQLWTSPRIWSRPSDGRTGRCSSRLARVRWCAAGCPRSPRPPARTRARRRWRPCAWTTAWWTYSSWSGCPLFSPRKRFRQYTWSPRARVVCTHAHTPRIGRFAARRRVTVVVSGRGRRWDQRSRRAHDAVLENTNVWGRVTVGARNENPYADITSVDTRISRRIPIFAQRVFTWNHYE